jgi:hypothetical protein
MGNGNPFKKQRSSFHLTGILKKCRQSKLFGYDKTRPCARQSRGAHENQ